MSRHLAWILSFALIAPAAAGPVQPVVETRPPGVVVCLASPERTLTWLQDAVARARSLGLPARGLETLSRWMETEVGADLFSTAGWKKAGLDPARPLCVSGPVPESDRAVVTFGVSDAKKATEVARRLAKMRDPAIGVPKSSARKGAKVWTFRHGDEVLAFAVRGRLGYLAVSGDDLDVLLGRANPDPASGWSFPEGEVVIAFHLDVRALGAALGDDAVSKAADMVTPEVAGTFVVAGREARLDVRGPSVGLLALAGGVLEKTSPDVGRPALERLPADASGFLQVRLPLAAILQAWRASQGQGAPGDGPLLPAGWDDLARGLTGDVLLATQDGLAGLLLLAGVADEAATRRAIPGIAEDLRAAGVSATVEDLPVGGATGWTLRFGAEDSPLRFPVFAALRDRVLIVSLSRPRLEAAREAPPSRYLDALDHPLVLDGLKSGAVLIGHGYESDSLGGLLPYAAILREALQGDRAAWMDLFDGTALALDLTDDSGLVARVSSSDWSFQVVTRFLGADSGSADPGERLFAQAVRARMEGRAAAGRAVLLALAQTGRNGPYGAKARRCLVQPEPVSDFLIGAMVAGVLAAWPAASTSAEAPEEEVLPDEPGMEMLPCQKYLLQSCLGQDPEGPSCRKARAFFEREDGPTAEDQAECGRLLGE